MSTIKNKPKAPNVALSEVIGAPAPALNLRAKEVSLKGDKLKDYSIKLQNIDEALIFHLKEVVKPYVIENDTRVPVPIIYANPERWKSAQLDGGIRDKEGKIIFPIIVLKKDSIERNLELGNKLDGNKVHNYNIFEQKYTSKDQYSNFSALNNRKPKKSFRMVPVPDYYNITYTCSVYVNDTEDLNNVLESIMYASRSYWGDAERFRFMVNVQDTPITQELNEGENRKTYSEFTLLLSGYIIPDSINQFMSTEKKFFSKAEVIFNTDVVSKIADASKKPSTGSGGGSESCKPQKPPALYPTFINPAVSMHNSVGDGIVEVGHTQRITITLNFDPGEIKGAISSVTPYGWDPDLKQNNRSGNALNYVINNSNSGLNNSITINNYTPINGYNIFYGHVNYSQGPQPLDSNRVNYVTPLLAGATQTVNTMFLSAYKQFFGNVIEFPTDSEGVRSLDNDNFSNINTFESAITSVRYLLAIPATKELVSVITENREDLTDLFLLSLALTQVADASGNLVDYKVYEFSTDSPLNINIVINLSYNVNI